MTAEQSADYVVLAGRIMEAWFAAGLIEDDPSRQGMEDPEWRKAKVALAELDELGLLLIDGSDG